MKLKTEAVEKINETTSWFSEEVNNNCHSSSKTNQEKKRGHKLLMKQRYHYRPCRHYR